jgi:Protein of unknown function (DUF3592)
MYNFIIVAALFIIGGIISVYMSLKSIKLRNRLQQNGTVTEGIVFDFVSENENLRGDMQNTPTPIIRFVTKNQQWITQPANNSFISNQLRQGDKVTVVYDDKEPEQFILKSTFNQVWLYYFLVIAGLCSIIGGSIYFFAELYSEVE